MLSEKFIRDYDHVMAVNSGIEIEHFFSVWINQITADKDIKKRVWSAIMDKLTERSRR